MLALADVWGSLHLEPPDGSPFSSLWPHYAREDTCQMDVVSEQGNPVKGHIEDHFAIFSKTYVFIYVFWCFVCICLVLLWFSYVFQINPVVFFGFPKVFLGFPPISLVFLWFSFVFH